jgi:CAAX protease family protein
MKTPLHSDADAAHARALTSGESASTVTDYGEAKRARGGWGWLVLPALLMFVGSNLAWGVFMAQLHDPKAAGMRTVAIGPVVWSVLQLVLAVIAVRQLRRLGAAPARMIDFRPRRLARDVGIGAAVAVVASVVIVLALRLQEPIFGPSTIPFARWAIWWWTLVASLTAGFGEELYFRGFLFRRLGHLKPAPLLLVTSLSFAIWHLGPNLLLHTFLVGLLFGWLYRRTGRLMPVIVAHVLTDAIGGLLMLQGYA